jgi:hypothetical protein
MRQVLSALVLVVITVTGGAVSAHAEVRACVNLGEYRQVHMGMTKHRAQQVFDTNGRRTAFSRRGGSTFEIRRYRGCPRHSAVSVAYGNRRVRSKSASWQ